MFNLNQYIVDTPARCHRLSLGDSLFTVYNCGLEERFADLWSHNNYIVYVAEGRKVWHTAHGSYDLQPGSCVFIRPGAAIVEQFLETGFCFYLFFVSDTFIREVLKTRSTPLDNAGKQFNAIISIDNSEAVHAFFKSMLPYFNSPVVPDQSLLELKFRELILILSDNNTNAELRSYFHSILQEPTARSLQSVMEDNFCFNLKLEDYARLCHRSLSAFKRDFLQVYKVSPGKWLAEKRLNHSRHLLSNARKSISEIAFESGFENISHFSRAFSKQFGMPPSAMKKSTAILN